MSAALRSLSALLIAVLASAAWAAKGDVPFLTGRVVDNAEILSAGTVERITALLIVIVPAERRMRIGSRLRARPTSSPASSASR